MAGASRIEQEPWSGAFPNGMQYVTWGRGPRTLLFIQGGPGSAIPKGMLLRMSRRLLDPYVEAGFTVWALTRRRHMPLGHTVADMADDHALAIAEELGGRVDLVVAESYGGMIAQYLAALHPEALRYLALVATGANGTDWGNDVDSRMAAAQARGDATGVGMAFAEYVLPGERMRWARRLIGPLLGRSMLSTDVPPEDFLIEARAGEAFDARGVLPRILAPVLLICGDRDRFFSREMVEETAKLIPDCALVWYEGKGHLRTGSSRRVAHDVLAFVNRV